MNHCVKSITASKTNRRPVYCWKLRRECHLFEYLTLKLFCGIRCNERCLDLVEHIDGSKYLGGEKTAFPHVPQYCTVLSHECIKAGKGVNQALQNRLAVQDPVFPQTSNNGIKRYYESLSGDQRWHRERFQHCRKHSSDAVHPAKSA